MSLFTTVNEYCDKSDEAGKAVFFAAMTKRIKEQGFTMQDLFYEVYTCQCEIHCLKATLEAIEGACSKKTKKKAA